MSIRAVGDAAYRSVYKDFHSGEITDIQRPIPKKLHSFLPQDVVELSRKKNDDWKEGQEVVVKGFTRRTPNAVQIENDKGVKTVVPYFQLNPTAPWQLNTDEEDAVREKETFENAYLLWP